MQESENQWINILVGVIMSKKKDNVDESMSKLYSK